MDLNVGNGGKINNLEVCIPLFKFFSEHFTQIPIKLYFSYFSLFLGYFLLKIFFSIFNSIFFL